MPNVRECPKLVDILIENASFLVCDAKTIIKNGTVAVEKNKIIDFGKNEEIKKKYKADKVIDAKWKVVMPGLVDCHSHGAENLFKGLHYDLKNRFSRFIVPGQFFFNEKNAHVFYLLTYADQIRSGTTCPLDMYFFPDVICKAAHESGLRVNVAPYVFDFKPKQAQVWGKRFIDAKDPESQLKNIEAAIKKWHGADNDRIRLMYGIHTVFDNGPEHIQRVRELATKHGVGITIHLNEHTSDVELSKKLYGKRELEYVHGLGLLGPDVAAVHCIFLSKAEMQMIVKTDTKVVHDPKANMMLGLGVCPVPELLEMGVTVSLGSNGTGHSAEVDMFNNMKMAAILHKLNKMDNTVMLPSTVFELATMGGAKTLLLDKDIGTIEKGKKADIILVDVKKPRFFPILAETIMNHLVYTAHGSDVDTVIVDGKILMENRQLTTIDEKEILEKGQIEAEKFVSEFSPSSLK